MVVRRVDAIQIERGLISSNAADRRPRLIVRAYPKEISRAWQKRCARRKPGQFVEAASIQRQIRDLLICDLLPESTGLGIDQRCRGGYFDLGRSLAKSQR